MSEETPRRYVAVDLGRETSEIREIPEETVRSCPSGIALATHLLHESGGAGADPLGPGNAVVLAPGLLAGTPFPGATRAAVVTRSPVTGLWAGGTFGGLFAWALRQTGWDAVVLEGRARRLTYLLLDEGRVFFRSAEELRGRGCPETARSLQELWGTRASALCIGPAGEEELAFAVADTGSWEGHVRGGVGAVLGSKNVKAIVARPHAPVRLAHAREFLEALQPVLKETAVARPAPDRGMVSGEELSALAGSGALGTGGLLRPDALDSWLDSVSKLASRRRSCPGCPAACLALAHVPGGDGSAVALVTEHLWALGPLLGLDEVGPALPVLRACRDQGIDPVSLGITLAWAAEHRDSEADDPEIAVDFGDGRRFHELARALAEDPGFRESLGRRVARASAQPGAPAGETPPEDGWTLLDAVGVCGRIAISASDLLGRVPDLLAHLRPGLRVTQDEVASWGSNCGERIRRFNERAASNRSDGKSGPIREAS